MLRAVRLRGSGRASRNINEGLGIVTHVGALDERIATHAEPSGDALGVDLHRRNLSALDEPRPGPTEEPVAVGDEMKLSGAEIHARHRAGSLATPWMGRQGGLNGAQLAKDIASGTWRAQRYGCSSKPVQNPDWFSADEFVARVEATQPAQ